VLENTSGQGFIRYIECKATAGGKTASPPAETLVVTLSLSNCTAAGLTVSATDSSNWVFLKAKVPTWSRYYGPTTGGGTVSIPMDMDFSGGAGAFEFKISYGSLLNCTIEVMDANGNTPITYGFWVSPYTGEWALERVGAFVIVSGSTASRCGPSNSSWRIGTYHPATSPHLEILEY
jgi:hypothetical protein